MERFLFNVDGARIVGNLHLPQMKMSKVPAVVVAGPMTSVKEQVTGVYAAALAKRGYAALAIDHRHFGESEGEPRQYEYYHDKITDLSAAVDALVEDERIDNERMGIVGVCLGAGYAAWAAVNNAHVKAFGAVVGYYRDVPSMKDADPEGFAAKVDQGVEARRHYEKTGEVLMIPAAALEGDAAMTLQSTYDYYATPRAGVANYRNEFAIMSREHFLQFDVQPAAKQIKVPVRMIHSENGLSPKWAKKFFENLDAPKDLLWIDGPNQTAFYDSPQLVDRASDLLGEFLDEKIG